MAPVVLECRRRPGIEAMVCTTGQHRDIAGPILDWFGIKADLDLAVMEPQQTLAGLTARCLTKIDAALAEHSPTCVVAQGDTTSVLAASLAAFYRRIPFVHVEAGLRTGNLNARWPEEFNRRAAALTASLHCAPTQGAADALLAEGVSKASVHITGNTVIDALLWTQNRAKDQSGQWSDRYSFLNGSRMVLITGHRRENFGDGFQNICQAIAELAGQHPNVAFVYPVHLNPNVQEPVRAILSNRPNVHLIAPAHYPEFVWLMDRSTIILSDSGGVQEEAPSLGKPVLVMRETTERPEAVAAGACELVGTDTRRIVTSVSRLLTDPKEYARRQIGSNPYGDGQAARRIVDLMLAAGAN